MKKTKEKAINRKRIWLVRSVFKERESVTSLGLGSEKFVSLTVDDEIGKSAGLQVSNDSGRFRDDLLNEVV